MAARMTESSYSQPATPPRRSAIHNTPAYPSSPSVSELWDADLDLEVWKRQLELWEIA